VGIVVFLEAGDLAAGDAEDVAPVAAEFRAGCLDGEGSVTKHDLGERETARGPRGAAIA
jgi:hypothetical protein